MDGGKIVAGIALLVIGISIAGLSLVYYDKITSGVEQCGSILGQLGQTFDEHISEACSSSRTYQIYTIAGMLFGGALAIIGLVLAIAGAAQSGEKRIDNLPYQSINSVPQKEYRTSRRKVNKMFCRYCGKERDDSGGLCSRCGRGGTI